MQIQVFRVPCVNGDVELNEVQNFIQHQKVVEVEKALVQDQQQSFWAFCITYAGQINKVANKGSKFSDQDFKDTLTPEAFALYCKLKEKRSEIAAEMNIRLYLILSNQQLANMA